MSKTQPIINKTSKNNMKRDYFKLTDTTPMSHKRETNPNATWEFQALFMFTDDTIIYPEEKIPHVRGKVLINGKSDYLVMDCTPDCRQIYWYLRSQPTNIQWTLREPYDLCMFKYAQKKLCISQYMMIDQMMNQLDIDDNVQLITFLTSYVDKGIKRINKYLTANGMD